MERRHQKWRLARFPHSSGWHPSCRAGTRSLLQDVDAASHAWRHGSRCQHPRFELKNTRMKTATDLHWNRRAASVANDVEVNIMDIFQRDVEYEHVCKYLRPDMTVLETGCGNGFSSAKFRPLVKQLDGFDYAENMIERAKGIYGETNNRFLHDNLLEPVKIGQNYDCAICVRVLINLANLEQQIAGVKNLAKAIKPSGTLILVEGFMDGFI